MAKGKILGDYIEKWHVKKADWQGEHELEVLGVSNTEGITTTSHVKSEDLSGYLVIEPNTFAYNPYRINVGSVGLTPNNVFGVVSPAYIVFKVREGKLIPELLLEFLKSFDGLQQINKYARGTVRKALRFDDLCKIEVNFPDYNEQKNIFKKKLIVEKKSNELESEIQTQKQFLTQLKQSILQEAIQGKLTSEWRASHPELVEGSHSAEALLKRIKAEKAQLIKDKKIKKDKPLPPITEEEIPFELPEGWIWCRGFYVAQYIDPQPSHRTPPVSSDGIPYVSMKDINNDGEIDLSTARKVGKKILLEHKNRYTLEKGDFIFGKIGTIGNPVWLTTPFNYTLSANLILIQPNRDILIPEYFFLFLSSPHAASHLKDSKSEMSYPVFGMKKARLMPVILPPLEEQKAIIEKVESLMQKCQALEQEIKTSEVHAQMLMQAVLKEAFEGKKEEVYES